MNDRINRLIRLGKDHHCCQNNKTETTTSYVMEVYTTTYLDKYKTKCDYASRYNLFTENTGDRWFY